MTDSTESALTRAMLGAPADALPRLVLADYLNERCSEGDEARAEFLRGPLGGLSVAFSAVATALVPVFQRVARQLVAIGQAVATHQPTGPKRGRRPGRDRRRARGQGRGNR